MPIDRVQFYQNERFASGDLTTLERIAERFLEDTVAYAQRGHGLDAYASAESQPRAVVLGGLYVQVDGSNLEIGPGMMITTEPPVDGADNQTSSQGYIGINAVAALVPIPTPDSDMHYIVYARPTLTDEPAVPVDIYTPGAGFAPESLVKRRTASLAFFVEESNADNFIDYGGAVPLFGVYRAGGVGTIDLAHVVDLRPMRHAQRPIGGGAALVVNQWRYRGGEGLTLHVQAQLDDLDLHAHTTAAPLDPVAFKDPTQAAPAANEWWYLYLARYRAMGDLVVPRRAQRLLAGLHQQGLLILSKTEPFPAGSYLARRNAGALYAPQPFASVEIPIADAVCFGALRRTASNTEWIWSQADGDHVALLPTFTPEIEVPEDEFTSIGAPVGARLLDLRVESVPAPDGLDVTSGTTLVYRNGATTGDYMHLDLYEVPIASGSDELRFAGVGLPDTLTVQLRGYRF
jgi:hypothetical protein